MLYQYTMLKNFLLDLIFPRFCLGCSKELDLKQASFICEACFNDIALNSVQCHICGLRNKNGTCQKCRKKTFLNGLFAAGKYQDPTLREAIHQFKYQSMESLKKPLAQLMINYLEKEKLINKLSPSGGSPEGRKNFTPILTPIPLTMFRKLRRGFNQSELLAIEISKYLNFPIVKLLKRKKFSAPQARTKDWQTRKENVSGAFCLSKPPTLISDINNPIIDIGYQYKKVILVDDVSTSGATLEEAARILKEAGAKEVYGLVVAK